MIDEINIGLANNEVPQMPTRSTGGVHQLNVLREFQVPHKERELIVKVHNEHAGHHGVERTFDKLVKMGHHWPHMREHVRYFIKRCPFCQKMSYLKTPIFTNPFTTAVNRGQERQNWDTIGPITLTSGRKVYILVAIDCFSRWVELWSIPDTEMLTVRLPMLQHFGRYGVPSQILTDNGSQFVNGTVEELVKMCGHQHIKVLAYSKEENSIVERSNKEVVRHLRALIYALNENENIEDLLPSVQRILNANRVEPNRTTPADILFGNSIDLDRGIFLPAPVLKKMNISLSDWASNMLKEQKRIIEQAEKVQRAKDVAHIANADPRRTDFAIGSYVLVEHHASILRRGPENKLNTFLRGPFVVRRRDNEIDMYTLWDSNTRKELQAHMTMLHPFQYDPQFVDPEEVAMRDVTSTFRTASISAHTGHRSKKMEMTFLVQWQGYDNSYDKWIPWKEVRDNVHLHEYLLNSKMIALIPKEHRTGRFENYPVAVPTIIQRPVTAMAARLRRRK